MNMDVSSSGEITSSFERVSDVFTSYEEIPSKGFNRLFKAQRYGKWFVLKGLKPEFIDREVYRSLLTKEFELGVRMDHPNIAHIFSREDDPVAGPCIVMEYVDGVTLKEFLAQAPSRTLRTKVVRETLSAMAYYHSLQIVHRDLKPDNILVTRNGHNVKIIDFGLADTDYHGILKQPAGSARYAAPEQKSGDAPLDCRADIYSFGIILQQIFPLGYGGIVRKCTQPDRERRFRNADEILSRMQRREKLVPGVVTGICVFFLALGVWWFSSQSQDKTAETGSAVAEATFTNETSNGTAMGNEEVADVALTPLPTQGPAVATVSQTEQNTARELEEEVDLTSEDYVYRKIPKEVRKEIEQAVDTLVEHQFWDWERIAESTGMAPIEKLSKYSQSDFFTNNYQTRERHRESVLSDLSRRYPQCESVRETMTTYYNYIFAKRMIAVSEVVNGWQRAVR